VRRASRHGLAAAALCAALALTGSGAARAPRVPALDHVVVVVFENHERDTILGSSDAPTFNSLASTYAEATNYHAVAHPSLPNYLALVSGSTHGVTTDCVDCPQPGPTIGTLLTRAHRSWGVYAEGYPASKEFAKKHVPFLYFPGGAAHVRPLTAFRPSRLPRFSFVVPDMCHDMHDCSVATGDAWLARFIRPLLRLKRTAVFVAFDEGTSRVGGGGMVPLIVAGTAVRPRATYTASADHYTLLRTISEALGVRPLGRAAQATAINGIWR
jgi:phosphatidylinositol-3-phosphatase